MQETVKHQDAAMKLKSEKNELIIQLRELREKLKVEAEVRLVSLIVTFLKMLS
jgi:hypothetical protein